MKEPIRIGFALTVGILLAVITLAYCRWPEFKQLKPNELGDCLAGVSSTIAFIWLIVAVFLQRQELQAQRQELSLSRKVYTKQADELKRTADQQKLQVEIMGEQLASATAERKSRELAEQQNRRRQIDFDLDAVQREYNALEAYKTHVRNLLDLLDPRIAGAQRNAIPERWPFGRALAHARSVGRLNSILGGIPSESVGPLIQNLLQNLQTLAQSAQNCLDQLLSSHGPTSRTAEQRLDQIEPEAKLKVEELRGFTGIIETAQERKRDRIADLNALQQA